MALWSKKAKTETPPIPEAANGARKGAAAQEARAAKDPAKELSSDEMKKRSAASAHLLFRFGEVVSVLMREPGFRDLPLKEIQALVVPPLVSGQFLVAEGRSKSQGFVTPLATALWAKVSPEVDRRLSQSPEQPIRLAPGEWKSGDIAWLVALAGNAQAIAPMLKKFQDTALKGEPLKMRAKGKDGKMMVRTFAGQAKR